MEVITKVSSDPNSNHWVLKWGSVDITIDGRPVKTEDCCYAESGKDGCVHIYNRTKAGQILTVRKIPKVTIFKGNVTVNVGNTAGCKSCTRNSYKRRDWWKLAHLEK